MSQQGESIGTHEEFSLRMATVNDLDDITRIHIAGFTEEPEVHYRYPLRQQYSEDHWQWTRKEYECYLKQPQKFVVHVLDVSSESGGSTVMKPVGLAIWIIDVKLKADVTGMLNLFQRFRLS